MVRDARPADADAIAAVHLRTWQVAYRGLIPDDVLDSFELDEWTANRRRRLADPGIHTFVAETDGTVCGFVSVGPSRDDDMIGEGELYALYVEPERWGHGLGRALHAAGIDTLGDLGFREAALWVLEANERARRFYERAGWALDEPACKLLPSGMARGLTEVRYRRKLSASST
jgi:GNAT superfamily N-acetyltransferase